MVYAEDLLEHSCQLQGEAGFGRCGTILEELPYKLRVA